MMLEFKAVHMNIWFSGFVLFRSACISRKSRLRRYRYLGCLRRLVGRRSHRKVGASRTDTVQRQSPEMPAWTDTTSIGGVWPSMTTGNFPTMHVSVLRHGCCLVKHTIVLLCCFFLLNPLKIDTLNDRFKLCCLSIIFRSGGRGRILRTTHYLAWVHISEIHPCKTFFLYTFACYTFCLYVLYAFYFKTFTPNLQKSVRHWADLSPA